MNEIPEEPLTDDERTALGALPRERIPPAHLEDRVVAALTREGLLSRAETRPRQHSGGWRAAAIAAGVALFALGTATGQRMATQDAMEALTAALGDDAASRAARVQETGSAYVQAVARLSEGSGDSSPSGLEAARVALHAAALELARANPDDPTIQLVLAVLEERAQAAGSGGDVRQTIWF